MSRRLEERQSHWQAMQAVKREESERLAILSAPPPKNDPKLSAPTRVRVIKAFMVNGERMEPDTTATIDYFTAESMQALGKCKIL